MSGLLMSGLLHALLTLAIILIGIGVMIGRISLSGALTEIVCLVVLLYAASAFAAHMGNVWASSSAATRVAAVTVILLVTPIFLLMSALRSDFGQKVLASVIGDWIYDHLRVEGCGPTVLLLILTVAMIALLFG